jgi:hypothetical protein
MVDPRFLSRLILTRAASEFAPFTHSPLEFSLSPLFPPGLSALLTQDAGGVAYQGLHIALHAIRIT